MCGRKEASMAGFESASREVIDEVRQGFCLETNGGI